MKMNAKKLIPQSLKDIKYMGRQHFAAVSLLLLTWTWKKGPNILACSHSFHRYEGGWKFSCSNSWILIQKEVGSNKIRRNQQKLKVRIIILTHFIGNKTPINIFLGSSRGPCNLSASKWMFAPMWSYIAFSNNPPLGHQIASIFDARGRYLS